MEAVGFSFLVTGAAAPLQGATTSARIYRGTGQSRGTLLLAHGAGAPQSHPWMITVARAVSVRGLDVVTFNFLYAEASRRAPDRNELLETTFRAAIRAVRARHDVDPSPLFIGGKSMGARIATQLAAADHDDGALDVAGLVLLGYPLHPPGKPQQLRASHLPMVRAPMLFVQGSRDAFGTPGELGPVLKELEPRARTFVVEGGDHSLTTRRQSGRTLQTTIDGVADEILAFVGTQPR